jgi:hypothetical protein
MRRVSFVSVAELLLLGLAVMPLSAQYGGTGGGTTGSTTATSTGTTGPVGTPTMPTNVLTPNEHLGFDRPEAWGLKYFTAATLLSGLQPPSSGEEHHPWSVNVAFETGWLPSLDAGQEQIGFHGKAPEDLNKAPVFMRPVVRIGLPWNLTAVVAAPPPFEVFGVTPRLLAFGLEGPIAERNGWTLSWRGYGQVGYVKGAFTCPNSVLPFAPGTTGNPEGCLEASNDKANLRYAGGEVQVGYRVPHTKLVPHATVGGTFVDGDFQVNAVDTHAIDHSNLWTHGGMLSTTGGVSYLITQRVAFTVDMFYSPLEVRRTAASPVTNDGLLNVRALLSYTFR